jgi:hypothetical protein
MSAVDAAVAVADAHGVRCEKPVVLREAWHVLVHLWPSPVVARVTSGAPDNSIRVGAPLMPGSAQRATNAGCRTGRPSSASMGDGLNPFTVQ